MADPVSLALVGVSTALSASSALSQGSANAGQQNALAQDSEYQATVNRQNAAQAVSAAGAREDAQRQQARYQLGEQAAGMAQSGIVAASGSGAAVERQSAINKELAALNIRYEGAVQSTGDLNQASVDDNQALRQRQNATYSRQSSYLSALGAVFAGAGRYAGGGLKGPTNTAGWISQG